MRHLSHAIPKVAGQAFARKYIMLGRLVTQWPEIVGAEMAAKTAPAALRYSKGKEKPLVSLDIAASSAEATLLMYRKDIILGRINALFGEGWISAIRFVPKAANAAPARPRKPVKNLTEDEKVYLSDVLEGVGDADLQASLRILGQAILQDKK